MFKKNHAYFEGNIGNSCLKATFNYHTFEQQQHVSTKNINSLMHTRLETMPRQASVGTMGWKSEEIAGILEPHKASNNIPTLAETII